MNHGIYVSEQATAVSTPAVAESGVPFVVGIAPVFAADSPAETGMPVLCTGYSEAVRKLGYSDDWESYTICEFLYSHFKLFGMQPAIFVNVLDLTKSAHKTTVAAADIDVTDHKATLAAGAIDDNTLVVKNKPQSGTAVSLEKGTDYDTFYDGDKLVVELLSGSTYYSDAKLNIAYTKANPAGVTDAEIAAGIEAAELCAAKLGTVPDIICVPGYSHKSAIAAAMAAKAAGINGMFRAKAIIDIDSSAVTEYSAVAAAKASAGLTDENEIVCWPMLKLGDYVFHMSTQLAGLMAKVDATNGGTPCESPSNKAFSADGVILADGTEVNLTLAQANNLNGAGIVTALSFLNGLTAWGDWTACWPGNTDVKDYFIPVSRMFDFVGNTLIKTFWSKLDEPMNRRLVDTIIDTANIWLNGLVGSGYLIAGRAEMSEDENPITDLMAGMIKIHIYLTPPSPAREIDFMLEYDASALVEAFS